MNEFYFSENRPDQVLVEDKFAELVQNRKIGQEKLHGVKLLDSLQVLIQVSSLVEQLGYGALQIKLLPEFLHDFLGRQIVF